MQVEGQDWFYSKEVKKHFMNPKNVLKNENEVKNYNGYGRVGNMKCGDIMELWLKIENGIIKKCKWRTFGCASAIASTSMLSIMITENSGMKIEDALKISGKDITQRLNGLPQIKIHCSVLGDEALREAIKNYDTNQEQNKNKKTKTNQNKNKNYSKQKIKQTKNKTRINKKTNNKK